MPDERTANREYLLPNPGHTLAVDVNRLRAALVQIDIDVAANLISDAARSVLIGNNALAASANSAEVTALKANPVFSGNGSIPNLPASNNSSSIPNSKLIHDVVLDRLFLQGFINGLITTRNVTTPNTHIDIGVGSSWVGDRIIQNVAPFTKRLDAIWAAGTGNGGLFIGVRAANTWYHLFILRNDTTGAIDFGFDTSVSAANRPVGWTSRLIWSVRTDASSNIIGYAQTGDICTWLSPPVDLNNVANIPSANGQLFTMSVPLGLSCLSQFSVFVFGSGQFYYLSSPLSADLDVGTAGVARFHMQAVVQPGLVIQILTNTASQIRIRAATVTSDGVSVSTAFYIHPRGRLV